VSDQGSLDGVEAPLDAHVAELEPRGLQGRPASGEGERRERRGREEGETRERRGREGVRCVLGDEGSKGAKAALPVRLGVEAPPNLPHQRKEGKHMGV